MGRARPGEKRLRRESNKEASNILNGNLEAQTTLSHEFWSSGKQNLDYSRVYIPLKFLNRALKNLPLYLFCQRFWERTAQCLHLSY